MKPWRLVPLKHHGPHSVLTRVLQHLIVAGLALFLVAGGLLHFAFQDPNQGQKRAASLNLENYVTYLSRDLDLLEGTELANALARLARDQKLLARVRFADGGELAGPGGIVPPFGALHGVGKWSTARMSVGVENGRGVVEIASGSRRYLFALEGEGLFPFRGGYVVVALALGVLILGFLNWRLRRLLWPVREMRRGVEALANGELSARVRVRRRDELGDLAQAFNRMAGELEAMVSAREELLLGVSHELRTPITRARLALEFLPEGGRRNALVEDLAEIAQLVEELLEFGRLRGTPAMEASFFAPHALLQEACARAAENPLGEERGEFRCTVEIAPGVEELRANADRARLARLLRNLLENARAYGSSDDGVVRVRVEARSEDETLIVRVRDEGKGVPPEQAERIFLPFTRLETSRSKRHGGLGLGLALARRIAEAHGGTLLVIPTEKGACFELRLPLTRL